MVMFVLARLWNPVESFSHCIRDVFWGTEFLHSEVARHFLAHRGSRHTIDRCHKGGTRAGWILSPPLLALFSAGA